ncbi:MAG: P1 family peptidase [Rhodomicrobium sp.]|nr:P1 family peptidase [Rhodomicrobium sp.]
MGVPGPRNLITDVAGLTVDNAHDDRLASGVTVVLCETATVAAASVFGGSPGSREMDALGLESTVGAADAIVLSGGSAFGLDAATGVQSFLRERGRGFAVRTARVPIVPQAILFDLLNGGDKSWGRHSPYRDMAYEAASAAAPGFELGSSGAGSGAMAAAGRGGLGSASERLSGLPGEAGADIAVGALTAVNAVGAVTVADTPYFWAAPFEQAAEFGGLGSPHPWPAGADRPQFKFPLAERGNTTLCAVATDAALTHAQCKRLAVMAAAGMARAIVPVVTPFDGDIVFALATGKVPLANAQLALPYIGAAAANCVARAIARGVFEARGSLPDGTLCYRGLFART